MFFIKIIQNLYIIIHIYFIPLQRILELIVFIF